MSQWEEKCLKIINDPDPFIHWFYDETKKININPFLESLKHNKAIQIVNKSDEVNFDLIINKQTKTVILIYSDDNYSVGLIRGLIRGVYSKTADGIISLTHHANQKDCMHFDNIQVVVLANNLKRDYIQTHSYEYNMNNI